MEESLAKYEKSAIAWSLVGVSLYYATQVYNTYMAPQLRFLLQFSPIPPSFPALEAKVFRLLLKGPGNWCKAEDMRALRRHLRFADEFRDLRLIGTAAKLRVIFKEAERVGGLQINKKADELDGTTHE